MRFQGCLGVDRGCVSGCHTEMLRGSRAAWRQDQALMCIKTAAKARSVVKSASGQGQPDPHLENRPPESALPGGHPGLAGQALEQ